MLWMDPGWQDETFTLKEYFKQRFWMNRVSFYYDSELCGVWLTYDYTSQGFPPELIQEALVNFLRDEAGWTVEAVDWREGAAASASSTSAAAGPEPAPAAEAGAADAATPR